MMPQPHFRPVWRRRVRHLVLAGAIALALSGQVIGASAAPKDDVSTNVNNDDVSTNVNWGSRKHGHG
jgi:hypothetical protein